MSQEWGIYLVLGLIIIILLSYVPQIVNLLRYARYRKIVKAVRPYDFLRERDIQVLTKSDPDYLHMQLHKLSSAWVRGPILIKAKNKYIYLSKKLTEKLIEEFYKCFGSKEIREGTRKNKKNIKRAMETLEYLDYSTDKMKELKKKLIEKYPFSTRLEVNATIDHFITHQLIVFRNNDKTI